jgi:hypothetical protein
MCLGSDMEQTLRQGEYRTTEDVGRLFERYRAEARHFAELADDELREEHAREWDTRAPVLASSR